MLRPGALLLVLLLVVVACSPQEEELRGLRYCGDLEVDDDYGNTRELDGADVIIFSRPGRFDPSQVPVVSGLTGDVRHVSRNAGPCGQQDLFLSFDDGSWCASVVARSWSAESCWDDLQPPALIPLTPTESFDGSAYLAWVPGPEASHVVATVDSAVTVAGFVRDGLALLVLPGEIDSIDVVDFDGHRTSMGP